MISQAKISRHPRTFKTLTGLSAEGFKQLLPACERAWESDLDRRDAGRVWRWAQGEAGGHGGQAGVHPGVFPALLHPSGAGVALRDGPAAGEWGSVSRWDPLVGSARKRLAESPKMKSFLLDFFKIYEGLSLTSSIESKGLSIQIN